MDQTAYTIEGFIKDAPNDDPHRVLLAAALARAIEDHGRTRYGPRAREESRGSNVPRGSTVVVRRRTAVECDGEARAMSS